MNEVINSIRRGEVDINSQQLFFSLLIKGLIYDLNNKLYLRNKNIPHYIVNTGDDIMYLEVKHEDHSIEPIENSNEAFVYTSVPRCTINTNDISIQTDQLTSPYTKGNFQVDVDDVLYGIYAEFRRVPVTMNIGLRYTLDSFTDSLELSQKIISHLSFIRNFNIIYLGQTIGCSYIIPDTLSHEKMIEFDGQTTDSKTKNINIELEVQSNYPVIYEKTAMLADAYIKFNNWNIDNYVKQQQMPEEVAKYIIKDVVDYNKRIMVYNKGVYKNIEGEWN